MLRAELFHYVCISSHRLGTILSDHLVNDSHLRKGDRQYKDLIVACEVCSRSNALAACVRTGFCAAYSLLKILLRISLGLARLKKHETLDSPH